MITADDKRQPSTAFSTGTPAAPERTDLVWVRPLRSYHDGSEMKTDVSPPYAVMRHHADELVTGKLAELVDAPPVVEVPVETGAGAGEQHTGQARAPEQGQQTASTVPALPGATPVRPDSGVTPPAATTEAPRHGRRGRRAARTA